jgi:hypothetical protein
VLLFCSIDVIGIVATPPKTITGRLRIAAFVYGL